MAQINNLVLSAGHGGLDPGATATHNGVTYKEKNLCWDLALLTYSILQHDPSLVAHLVPHVPETLVPRRERFINRVNYAKNFQETLFVEIHWNYSGSGHVAGAESYYAVDDEKGRSWASTLGHSVAGAMKSNFRGAFPENHSQHTRLGVLHGHLETASVCLLEVGFIDSPSDIQRWLQQPRLIANSIVVGAKKYLELP